MQLSDKVMRAFSDVIKSAAPNEKGQNPTVMGTVTGVNDNGGVMVRIDGAGDDSGTPATTLVGVDIGDRVDVLIQNHRAIITGNRSAPAVTRSNNSYMEMTDKGLIIGALDKDGKPSGVYLLVSTTGQSFQIIDPSKVDPTKPESGVLASFGSTVRIGELGNDVRMVIDGSNVRLVDSDGNLIAVFGAKSDVKQLETDNLIVNGQKDQYARLWVQGIDTSGNVAASVQLRAHPNGTIALYDTLRDKALLWEDTQGAVHTRNNMTVLSTTEYAATAISDSTYVDIPITNMSSWSMIVAYLAVSYDYTAVTFIKGGPSYQTVNCYNGNHNITGRITADWTNNRLRLSCTRGSATDYTQVKLRNVYGIFLA